MSLVIAPRSPRRAIVASAVLLVVSILGLLVVVSRAEATESVYWDNYRANPQTISFADISGNGGGALNLTGVTVETPEGMAYDTVTNRLFVATSSPKESRDGSITYVNLDGSGAGVLATPGTTPQEPEGVAVDPATRTIYWVNTSTSTDPGSIGWAKLDGSGGGILNTTGATMEDPYKIALDPVAGRIYWANTKPEPQVISWANVNGTGGGDLDITGEVPPESVTGLSVDPAAGRIYWLESKFEEVDFAPLAGGEAQKVDFSAVNIDSPYGLAFDPTQSRLYWGNYGQDEERTKAIGSVNLLGQDLGITPATAPLNGAQDPVILKSPTAAGAPVVTKTRAALSCSTGTWATDFPGSFVYQAPRSYAYQWTNNGVPIAGATAATLTAVAPGSYACVVTATNQTGSAVQTSAAIAVMASKVKLTTKKKAKVKPGGVATFNVQALNQGDVAAAKAKVCTKVPKKAKKFLKAPKCKALKSVVGGGKATAKLKIKVKPTAAAGSYKVTFKVTGSAGLSAKATILVAAPKKK